MGNPPVARKGRGISEQLTRSPGYNRHLSDRIHWEIQGRRRGGGTPGILGLPVWRGENFRCSRNFVPCQNPPPPELLTRQRPWSLCCKAVQTSDELLLVGAVNGRQMSSVLHATLLGRFPGRRHVIVDLRTSVNPICPVPSRYLVALLR